jgi:hypothetical protein
VIRSFLYDPRSDRGAAAPFATIVTKDYPGSGTSSELDRPGVFWLNLALGRETFRRLFGFRPAGFADHAAKLDFTELDRIVPHPVYAWQGWISVLTPGPRASAQEPELIGHAYRRARDRYCRAGLSGSYSA